MSDDDTSQGESLEEDAREANSNLQRLIEGIGALLAASGDLLVRLQQILAGVQPAARGSNGSDDSGTSPPTEPHDG